MIRKAAVTLMILGGGVWVLAPATRASRADAESAATEFKPVSSVHALMEGQGMFFKKINEAVLNPNAPRRVKEIAVSAELLAELANVNSQNSEKPDYVQWARQLRDASMELAAAARKEGGPSDDAMKSILARIEGTCKACHEKYQ